MCEYCGVKYHNAKLIDCDLGTGDNLEVAIYKNKEARLSILIGLNVSTEESVKINYCPMCGRKLGD